jgi:hypothetical protein
VKDQYVGDVNDYVTYGLLRALIAESGLSLGVWWMLTPNDQRGDGNHLGYLRDLAWRTYDPELHDALGAIVASGLREVAAVERAAVLPGATFVGEPIPDEAAARGAVATRALRALAAADVVFLDPDNGIEVPSTPPGRRGSSKYVLWAEIEALAARGRSLVVYQHFPRRPREPYLAELGATLARRTGLPGVMALWTTRNLFLVASRHEGLERACEAAAVRWAPVFRITHVAG